MTTSTNQYMPQPPVAQLVNKKDAKQRGLTRYFTGVPCVHGHLTERQVSNGTCLGCIAVKKQEYFIKNRDKLLKYRAERRLATLDASKERDRLYYLKNRERIREAHAKYSKKNSAAAVKRAMEWERRHPERKHAANMARRARMKKVLPSWFDEFDDLVWKEASRLVRLRSRLTGVKWHADHIIPMRCKIASGFHVGTNCQVIPAWLNIVKSNNLQILTAQEWIHLS